MITSSKNRPRPQNQTLPKMFQEYLGVKTLSEAYERIPSNQWLVEDIEAEVADIVRRGFDFSHGSVEHNPVSDVLNKARTNFIADMYRCGLTIKTIHYLVNLCDKKYGWGTISRKTLQRDFPRHGWNQAI